MGPLYKAVLLRTRNDRCGGDLGFGFAHHQVADQQGDTRAQILGLAGFSRRALQLYEECLEMSITMDSMDAELVLLSTLHLCRPISVQKSRWR